MASVAGRHEEGTMKSEGIMEFYSPLFDQSDGGSDGFTGILGS